MNLQGIRSGSVILSVGILLLATGVGQGQRQRQFQNLRTGVTGLADVRNFQGSLGSSQLSRFRNTTYGLQGRSNQTAGSLYRGSGVGGNYSTSLNTGSLNTGAASARVLAPINVSLSRGGPGGGSTYGIGLSRRLGRPNFAIDQVGPGQVIWLASGQTASQEDQHGWEAEPSSALVPWQGSLLARPRPSGPADPNVPRRYRQTIEPVQATTQRALRPRESKSQKFIAQQMSAARRYIQAGRFEQAIVALRAVLELDSKCTPARIGIIYTMLATGRYRSSGLHIIWLHQIEPGFWKQTYDLRKSLGNNYAALIENQSDILADLGRHIKLYTYDAEIDTAPGELPVSAGGYLGKAYMAWLRGDRSGVEQALQASAKDAPYHPEVQQMYNSFIGLRAELPKKDLLLKPFQ